MRMSADHERGKIADDVSVSDPQSVRTVSQRSNIKIQCTSGFRRLELPILFYKKLQKAFLGKLSKKSLGNKL